MNKRIKNTESAPEARRESGKSKPIVVQVTPAFLRNPEYGGPVVSALDLADDLNEIGCDARVISSWVKPGSRHFSWPEEERTHGTSVLYLGHIVRYRWSCIDIFGIVRACHWLNSAELVIVHGFRGFAGTILTFYAAAKAKNCWIFPHGMVGRKFRSMLLKAIFDATLGRVALLKYTAAIIYSNIEEQEIRAAALPRCRTIKLPPAVHEPSVVNGAFRARNGFQDDDIIILFVGRIIPIKNLHSLLLAFSRVRKTSWRLVYVGPTEDEQYAKDLTRLATGSNCSNSFHMIGPLYGTSKDAAINDSNLCVLPSTYESFGHFAWEAVTLGKPVIVTEQCGVADQIRHIANVCDPSPEALGEALTSALTNPMITPKTALQVNSERKAILSLELQRIGIEVKRVNSGDCCT